MKLIKLIPTLGAIAVLAACSTVNAVENVGQAVVDDAKSAGNAVVSGVSSVGTATKDLLTGSKTVAYTCSVNGKTNQPVSAVYTFNNGEPATATVTINKKVVGKDLKVDPSYKDGVKFISGTKVWSLDMGFNAQTADTTVPVMFTSNDVILAKNCAVAK